METKKIASYIGRAVGTIILIAFTLFFIGGAVMVGTEIFYQPQNTHPLAVAMGMVFLFFAFACGGLAYHLARHGLKAAIAII